MEEGKVVGFVGAHMDDIELACSGTIQRVIKNGCQAVVLAISTSPKMVEANHRTAKLLGYNLVFGEIPDNKIENPAEVQRITYEKLISPYTPELVFLHLPDDYHHEHRIVSIGSISACRRVKNILYFAGPGAIPHLRPQVFVPFGEEEMKRKEAAVEIMKKAYGSTRYFTKEHMRDQAAFWGQWIFEFQERPNAPQVTLFGKDQLPYSEVFQIERLRLSFDEGKIVLF